MRLIDKGIAYNVLSEYYRHTGVLQYMALREALDRVPVVDAEPVRYGHWIGIDDEPHEVWECDRCGYTYESEHRYNYCPHCGADMRGEKDGTGK